MARNYSTKHFFRQMSNASLARYFHQRGQFTEFDFAAMKEGNPEPLFEVWLQLPTLDRNVMDSEFREIFELSCEKGWKAILDEANEQLQDNPDSLHAFIETFAALANHYERAMGTFLDHRAFWRGATLFHHADQLQYWRKRKNMLHHKAATDDNSLQQLAGLIRDYFRYTEGRGNNCVVEWFRRGGLDYYFAYPEDYSQQSIEWVNGEFDRRPHNPAFEIVYIYSQQDGSLDLNFRGARKAIEPLQGMFATTILNLEELPPNPEDTRVYDLAPLLDKGFQFSPDPASGIEEVVVKKMRLSSRVKKGERITLEADAKQNPDAVYDTLDRLKRSLPIWAFNLTQVELSAAVVVNPLKPPKRVPIRITYPNSCSLKYDELGLRLRDMLVASGIELKEEQEVPAEPEVESIPA